MGSHMFDIEHTGCKIQRQQIGRIRRAAQNQSRFSFRTTVIPPLDSTTACLI